MAAPPGEVRAGGVTLAVRPMRVGEAALVVSYFLDAPDAELERMGVLERSRLPSREAWTGTLEATVGAPEGKASSFYYTWLADGQPIGQASLKNLRPGQSADLHLHMWSAPHRGHGHGALLFALCALDAHDRFRLRELVCEPQASNPMPNRMLQRSGYALVATREGASSELSRVTSLNRYRIDRDVAQAVLHGHRP